MKRWGRYTLVALATLLIVLSFLPLWQTDRWWVRQWDYPRIQVAGLLPIVAALLFVVALERTRWFWLLLGTMLAALGWQVSHFLAYLPPHAKQVASADNCPAGRLSRTARRNRCNCFLQPAHRRHRRGHHCRHPRSDNHLPSRHR